MRLISVAVINETFALNPSRIMAI